MVDDSDSESETEPEPLLEGQAVTDSLSKNDESDSDEAETVREETESDTS